MDLQMTLGAVPSPPDDRDYHVSTILPPATVPLPLSFFGSPVPPVLAQGDTPMCVGYSSTSMRMQQEYKDDHAWYQLDAPWLYRRAKERDGAPGVPGTYVRVAMKVLRDLGQAELPQPKRSQNIAAHRIAAYYAIPVATEEYLKRAIYAYGSVVIAGPWYDSWFHPLAGQGYILPRPDREAGGHAILANGWDDARGLLLQNSWTRAWGSSGRCFLPYRYIPGLWEAWRANDVPNA